MIAELCVTHNLVVHAYSKCFIQTHKKRFNVSTLLEMLAASRQLQPYACVF